VSDYSQIETDIQAAREEHERANKLRRTLRWGSKPGSVKRERDIDRRLRAIDAAMRPIRSHIGKLVWEPIPSELDDALRAVSADLQVERRQFKKMRRP
jgi:hypothetical protein